MLVTIRFFSLPTEPAARLRPSRIPLAAAAAVLLAIAFGLCGGYLDLGLLPRFAPRSRVLLPPPPELRQRVVVLGRPRIKHLDRLDEEPAHGRQVSARNPLFSALKTNG